jgi:hypothetical protein
MVGENVKMLCEQIGEEKGKTRSERLSSADEETEISFCTSAKIRGLEVAYIRIFIATQRPGYALSCSEDGILVSGGDKGAFYSGSGMGNIEDSEVGTRGAVYFDTKQHTGRCH